MKNSSILRPSIESKTSRFLSLNSPSRRPCSTCRTFPLPMCDFTGFLALKNAVRKERLSKTKPKPVDSAEKNKSMTNRKEKKMMQNKSYQNMLENQGSFFIRQPTKKKTGMQWTNPRIESQLPGALVKIRLGKLSLGKGLSCNLRLNASFREEGILYQIICFQMISYDFMSCPRFFSPRNKALWTDS